MATRSPQRSPTSAMQNQPPREKSPSPSFRDRQRTIKAHSMPLMPSVAQVFASQGQPPPKETSPTLSNNSSHQSRRSPTSTTQYPSTALLQQQQQQQQQQPRSNERTDHLERPPLQPAMQNHSHSSPNIQMHPRPVQRVPPPQIIRHFEEIAQIQHMTTEQLLAEISQNGAANMPHLHIGSPPKDPAVERIRASERSSPKEADSSHRRQQQQGQPSGDNQSNRDRQAASPPTSYTSHGQPSAHTPERRASPGYQNPLGSPNENSPSSYASGNKRDSPPVSRKNPANLEARSMTHDRSPPAQTNNVRTTDRSLPVQEEVEDDAVTAGKPHARDQEQWAQIRADIGRTSRAGHRDEDDETLIEQSDTNSIQDEDQNGGMSDQAYTPRSFAPSTLPDDTNNYYLHLAQNANPQRLGSTEVLLSTRPLDVSKSGLSPTDRRTNAYENPVHAPLPVQQRQYFSQYDQNQKQQQQYTTRIRPDELHHYLDYPDAAFYQSYMSSPRPDGPIPPTPHSQSVAPSPSPLISDGYTLEAQSVISSSFSPAPPAGSPYPHPFGHVMRQNPYAGRMQDAASYDAIRPSVIQDIKAQVARQWTMYALNNNGNVTDSTLSPSSTPAQAARFDSWANLHTNRTLGGPQADLRSMQSSPSHEPLEYPTLPPAGLRKKERSLSLRHTRPSKPRKPPPRVDSTQPRETSPEPSSSSGEETAGEERYVVAEEGSWVTGSAVSNDDDDGEWVDENFEGDGEDLLELEYHPSFVTNVDKRRRRWETKWDALIEAFHALDRQTDSTLVLLAAPSHSNKLYSVASRSIRRDAASHNSTAMSSLRTNFANVASRRKLTRARQKASLMSTLLSPSISSNGSIASIESREEELKAALGAALGSLGALGDIYEQREERWREETRRAHEERERVDLLLKQVFGMDTSMAKNVQVNGQK